MRWFKTGRHFPTRVYRVFRVPAARAADVDVLGKDDLVSRQSIEVREASALGVPGEGSIVLIEGSEAALVQAEALLRDVGTALKGADAEHAYRRFRSQDEDAASGMGLIFGG